MSGVVMKGMEALLDKLKAYGEENRKAGQRAVLKEAYALQAESQKECPVKTNRLRGSAYTKATDDGAKVGYGTDYSLYVHERTDIPHKVGKAKFLEDPLNRMKVGYAERIAKSLKEDK